MYPSSNVRERILAIGTWGTGKSEAWFRIADWHARNGSPARFFIADTDMYSADRILEELGTGDEIGLDGLTFRKYGNCYVYDVVEWEHAVKFAKFCSRAAFGNDWTVIDMIGPLWTLVQSAYTEMVYGKNIADFYIEAKKADLAKKAATGKSSGHVMADAYGSNWQVINQMYGQFTTNLLRNRGHIFACSPADKVDRENDSTEVVETFGKFGYKPVGQKHLGHMFHTILLLNNTPKGYTYTTLRDRKREMKVNAPLNDFVLSYLVPVAGWKMKKEGEE